MEVDIALADARIEDCRDANREKSSEAADVVLTLRSQTHATCTEVVVHVGKSRNHELDARVDDVRARGRLHRGGRADLRNPRTADDDDRVGNRSRGGVDQRGTGNDRGPDKVRATVV